MPIKMVALSRVYDKGLGIEYSPGDEFVVETENRANALIRMKRAKRMIAAVEATPEKSTRRTRYARRDMRAAE